MDSGDHDSHAARGTEAPDDPADASLDGDAQSVDDVVDASRDAEKSEELVTMTAEQFERWMSTGDRYVIEGDDEEVE